MARQSDGIQLQPQAPFIKSLFDFSDEALTGLRAWLEVNPPTVLISNIAGFSQFTANVATAVAADESTTATSYGALTTAGPVLTGLPDGSYLVVFGFTGTWSVGATDQRMSVSINGDSATDARSCVIGGQSSALSNSTARALAVTLATDGNNTITSQYRGSAGGSNAAHFSNRWLFALRYANS